MALCFFSECSASCGQRLGRSPFSIWALQ